MLADVAHGSFSTGATEVTSPLMSVVIPIASRSADLAQGPESGHEATLFIKFPIVLFDDNVNPNYRHATGYG